MNAEIGNTFYGVNNSISAAICSVDMTSIWVCAKALACSVVKAKMPSVLMPAIAARLRDGMPVVADNAAKTLW